jgi:hypothetical protein
MARETSNTGGQLKSFARDDRMKRRNEYDSAGC